MPFANTLRISLCALMLSYICAAQTEAQSVAQAVADKVDRAIESQWPTGYQPQPIVDDQTFLRRASLDLIGRIPTPQEITLFQLNPDINKRQQLVTTMLSSDDYAANWARYWRDVVFYRATDTRSRNFQFEYEDWLKTAFANNDSWSRIAEEMLTSVGDIRENGAGGLLIAHMGESEELASEASRIFMGIQIQCANCHDHPTDRWKREDFHTLAAYFPRVRVQFRARDTPPTMVVNSFDNTRTNPLQSLTNPDTIFQMADRNRDGKITAQEVQARGNLKRLFERIIERADSNNDGALTRKEISDLPAPPGQRFETEHFMSDLNNPASKGKLMKPAFFVNGETSPAKMNDAVRRQTFVEKLTSTENPWFARSFVNRMWTELVGQGFYYSVDDLGPDRTCDNEAALEVLVQHFVNSKYDIASLIQVITATNAYQRHMAQDASETFDAPYSGHQVQRLRADQVFNSLLSMTGTEESSLQRNRRGGSMMSFNRRRAPRTLFNTLFGFDPSTHQDDLSQTIPQALYLMNSSQLEQISVVDRNTRLGQLTAMHPNNRTLIEELFLMTLSRNPNQQELQLAEELFETTPQRHQAAEDLMWTLVNSTEFLSKR